MGRAGHTTPDLGRLRRAALGVALALITWSVAGVEIDSSQPVSVLGFPFRIRNPELLPIALLVAAVYCATRFYYYGLMLAAGPYRVRRDHLDGLLCMGNVPGRPTSPMYWGARKFQSSPWTDDYAGQKELARELESVWPRFAGARVRSSVAHHAWYDEEDDKERPSWAVEVTIPRRCRVAALLEDLDYTSPVWLNAVAILLYALR